MKGDLPHDDVICHLCLARWATHHLAVPSSSGQAEQAHYCPECYKAKYHKPPLPDAAFPRPRFTIKSIMILVSVWTVPNEVAAWIMRSGLVTGTPEQLRQWTIPAFVAVNLLLGFFTAWFYLMNWLGKVMWFHRTGGLVPMPHEKLTVRQQLAPLLHTWPTFAWCLAASFLARWMPSQMKPPLRSGPQLFSLILLSPLLAGLV